MKSCPACNRTYTDSSISFCLEDGSLLSPFFDPEETVRIPKQGATIDERRAPTSDRSGTITDPSTGLTWMIPFAGQNWINDAAVGPAATLSWSDATNHYGRGRKIRVSSSSVPAHVLRFSAAFDVSNESYDDYRLGSDNLTFADYDDWRMPTLEECFTLIRFSDGGYFTALSGDHWTANASNLSVESNVMAVRDWLSLPQCAWWCDGADMLDDEPIHRRHPLRLVRGGSVFKVLR